MRLHNAPTPTKLTITQLTAIQAVQKEQAVHQTEVNRLQALLNKIMDEAGLDPRNTYSISPDGTVTLQGENVANGERQTVPGDVSVKD